MIDPELKKEFKKIRKEQKNLRRGITLVMLILLAIAILICVQPVHAQTITMANPQGITERDIIVYWPNGTMQGYYNSTSVITLENDSDYIFAMKPMNSNPFEDPADWLVNTAFPLVQSNIIGIVLIIILAAIWARSIK